MWYIFGLLAAFFDTCFYGLVKKHTKNIEHYTLLGGSFLVGFVLFTIVTVYQGIPEIRPEFFFGILMTGTFNVVAALLYVRALQITDLSLAVPMIAFTPIFLLFTSFLILGEFPTTYGIIGIVCIVLGSYVLHITKKTKSMIDPIKHLFHDKGVLLMLLVAVTYSITASFDKVAIIYSDPYFAASAISLFLATFFLGASYIRTRKTISLIKKHYKPILITGIIWFGALFGTYMAMSLSIVTYAISLKRMSAIFSVIWGGMLFQEKDMVRRTIAAAMMVLGAVLIILL